MGVQTYVGARYVPKFTDKNGGDWDNTFSYEALEIVKHGSDFYTAKIPVPVGVAITDTQYWVLTGEYNGAIASLNTRVSDLESDVAGLEGIKAINTYNTVSDMLTAELVNGVVCTLGFYSVNDQGGSYYEVSDTAITPDNITSFQASNGKYVTLITVPSMNIKCFGAKGDGVTDDYAVFAKALTLCQQIILPASGDFYISADIELTGQSIIGEIQQMNDATPIIRNKGIIVHYKNNTVKNIHLVSSNQTNTAIKLSDLPGTSTACGQSIFENITINGYEYGIYLDAVVWNNIFNMIRVNFCNHALFKPSDTRACFGCTFTNFYTSGSKITNININRCSFIFDSGIFGFSVAGAIKISNNCNITFVNCNFECDRKIDAPSSDGYKSLIYVSGRSVIFDQCYFTPTTIDTICVCQFGAGVIKADFRACQYTLVAGSENILFLANDPLYVTALPIYGAIHFDEGCKGIPMQVASGTNADVPANFYPYIIYDFEARGIRVNAVGSLDSTKLGEGQLVYNLTQHAWYFYNGTTFAAV